MASFILTPLQEEYGRELWAYNPMDGSIWQVANIHKANAGTDGPDGSSMHTGFHCHLFTMDTTSSVQPTENMAMNSGKCGLNTRLPTNDIALFDLVRLCSEKLSQPNEKPDEPSSWMPSTVAPRFRRIRIIHRRCQRLLRGK